jgi:hypothetical protein
MDTAALAPPMGMPLVSWGDGSSEARRGHSDERRFRFHRIEWTATLRS